MISIFLTFIESLKIFLINLAIILMMSAKIATPDLLKITIFWNKAYDVKIHVNDVTNKGLSRESNYIVDVIPLAAYVLQYDETEYIFNSSCTDLLIKNSKFLFMTTNFFEIGLSDHHYIYNSQNKIWKFWTKEINIPEFQTIR